MLSQAKGRRATDRTLILGLGDPMAGDKGVGWIVAQELHERLAGRRARLDLACTGGWQILELLEGFGRALVVDGFRATGGDRGEPRKVSLAGDVDLDFLHLRLEVLRRAIEAPEWSRGPMPRSIGIWAIGVGDGSGSGTRLSVGIRNRIPSMVERILAEEFLRR